MLRGLALISLCALVQAQLPETDDVPRLWPQPSTVSTAGDTAASLVLDPSAFKIQAVQHDDGNEDVLRWNIAFYLREIFARPGAAGFGNATTNGSSVPLTSLRVTVEANVSAPSYPTLGVDESYAITLSSPTLTLFALN
jgi:hypothetical protein